MSFVYEIFNFILGQCYVLCKNYGLAIIIFTFMSKIILLPVSIWVQKNSIKMVKMQPEINHIKVMHFGDKDAVAEEEHKIYKKFGYNPFASIIPLVFQIVILIGLIATIKGNMIEGSYNLIFLGINLSQIPSIEKGLLILSPIFAGISSYLLCIAQNHSNVLQSEQGKGMQYGTMVFSVGLSLYLGWFVPIGVVVYWIASNLISIVQLYILNWLINPNQYIDYEALETSKKELEKLEKIGRQKKRTVDEKKKERADYKRFFSIGNKHLVFYSESSGFYKYFKGVIEYILETTNITVHYITSDYNDSIFELAQNNKQIKPYFIGEKKLITLMMKMDADIVVMTMPDLDNYHIKRSYVRKDIEYIFIPHSMCSLNLTMRTASMDHFDTIFCTGKHQREETEKTEIAYGLPRKKIVDWGYCLLDEMRSVYREKSKRLEEKTVLVAPSWQKDNIVDNCLEELLTSLRGHGYKIIVRPHPQHVKHQPERMEALKDKFKNNSEIEIQTDFSSNDTVFNADIMITDWSGIAYEYAFTTYKPVLFVDTPLKIMNPEYEKIDTLPFNILIREKIGRVIQPEDAVHAHQIINDMFLIEDSYKETIKEYAYDYVYNLDQSGEIGGKYIIQTLQNIVKERGVKNK